MAGRTDRPRNVVMTCGVLRTPRAAVDHGLRPLSNTIHPQHLL